LERLAANLREAGQTAVALSEQVLVTPFGGRVLGLFPEPNVNAFWVSPALEDLTATKRLLAEPDWINVGGDRTWVSPEVETHIADPARMPPEIIVPKAIDPGSYRVTAASDTSVTLSGDVELFFHRAGAPVRLALTKTVTLLAPPALVDGVRGAGYSLELTLRATAPLPATARPALWDLVQVSGGGTIILPTRDGAVPRTFSGQPVWTRNGNRLHCSVGGGRSFKFAIHAGDCRGAMACLNVAATPALLVARTFDVLDPSRYTDVPCADLQATGYVQQVYVDDGALGGFGELEHHSAALMPGEKVVTDHSRTWAFTGSPSALRQQLDALWAKQGDHTT
jgi:hypothetical protein